MILQLYTHYKIRSLEAIYVLHMTLSPKTLLIFFYNCIIIFFFQIEVDVTT